jgi:fructose-bisphosphate aldolase, class II
MPLTTLNDILPPARQAGNAVGAFNVANYETAVAVLSAAERERRPVILAIYQRLLGDARLRSLVAALRCMAERSPVAVVVHLDHGATLEQVTTAIDLGFSSVMLDASKLPLAENIATTRRAADLAHQAGLSIEGEIGQLPTPNEPVAYTDPDEAALFVRETGVDAVAVAIGTAHGFYTAPPLIKVEVARDIGRRISAPMVLHGGSDSPHDEIRAAVKCGMAKVNFATEYQFLFQQELKRRLLELGDRFTPVDLLMKPVVERISEHVGGIIRRLAQ